MRQVAIIAWHGFIQHLTSRAFLFGVMLLPIYMLIGGAFPQVSESQLALLGGPIRYFTVIDKTGVMMPAVDAALERDVTERGIILLADYAGKNADQDRLRSERSDLAALFLDGDPQSEAALAEVKRLGGITQAFVALQPFLKPSAPDFNEPYRRFFRIDPPAEIAAAEADKIAEAARPFVAAERQIPGPFGPVHLWAVLVIPQGFLDGSESAEYIADDLNRLGLRETLRVALDEELKRRQALALAVPGESVDKILNTGGTIRAIDPQPEHLGAVSYVRQLTVVGAIVVYLMLFMAVFMTANMVVMALVEEKSNRVAELLLSCVRAETLMAGKLFTGLMLAVFLVGVWLLSAMASIDFLFPSARAIVQNLTANISSVPQALQLFAFFALSYLTIGAFFLAAGSAATSITDAQAVVAPATMVTMPIFMLPIAVAYDPAGALARFMSYMPVFAPFTMMVRSLSAPEGLDVLGALAVSVLTLWFMVRLVARVFRANLLRPDASASFLGFLRDLWRGPSQA